MKLKNLFLLFLSALAFTACGGGDDDDLVPGGGGSTGGTTSTTVNVNRNSTAGNAIYGRYEFPHLNNANNYVIVHKTGDGVDPDGVNYCVEWDTSRKSQRWTCYQLTQANSVNKVSRKNNEINPQYPLDPDMPLAYYLDRPNATYAMSDYYYGSGFDHGHICPSADRLYSRTANDQTFYLTNMQPQYNSFNAGLWLVMENFVRSVSNSLASTDTMYVCKGGTIGNVTLDGTEQYGIMRYISDKLIVPKYFFATFIVKKKNQKTGAFEHGAFAFWAEHDTVNRSNEKLNDYIISIDELERRTGFDFFCNLPDELENTLEARTAETIITAWSTYKSYFK